MGGVTNFEDAQTDAFSRAFSRVTSYANDLDFDRYRDDQRIIEVFERASYILRAADAPTWVVGYSLENILVVSVGRINRDLPVLTTLDILEIIRDAYEKLRDWLIYD